MSAKADNRTSKALEFHSRELRKRSTMPNISSRTALNICIGLVVGMVLPILLFLSLLVADFILINFRYHYYQAGFGLRITQLCILLVPAEIISLFFLAKSNKTLTVAALPTAIIITAYIIYVAVTATPLAPD
jgi:hypothetical protein